MSKATFPIIDDACPLIPDLNLSRLASLASQVMDNTCHTITFLRRGCNFYIFRLHFPTPPPKSTCIARILRDPLVSPHTRHRLASEHSTLKFLEHQLPQIPIPNIFYHNLTPSGLGVGRPFFLERDIPGVNLHRIWSVLNSLQKHQIATQIAALLVLLSQPHPARANVKTPATEPAVSPMEITGFHVLGSISTIPLPPRTDPLESPPTFFLSQYAYNPFSGYDEKFEQAFYDLPAPPTIQTESAYQYLRYNVLHLFLARLAERPEDATLAKDALEAFNGVFKALGWRSVASSATSNSSSLPGSLNGPIWGRETRYLPVPGREGMLARMPYALLHPSGLDWGDLMVVVSEVGEVRVTGVLGWRGARVVPRCVMLRVPPWLRGVGEGSSESLAERDGAVRNELVKMVCEGVVPMMGDGKVERKRVEEERIMIRGCFEGWDALQRVWLFIEGMGEVLNYSDGRMRRWFSIEEQGGFLENMEHIRDIVKLDVFREEKDIVVKQGL